MRTVHVMIKGRVQGVGYRDWTVRTAKRHGLSGWVRNRMDGSVEAVFSGDELAVSAMLADCQRGPSISQVTEIVTSDAEAPSASGFERLPTV
ncbi:acylphosphatase [Lacibacterium aquatile]|uniref:acylphosphatase n=1 Tax=Lacibacterium aquatile TaxID=1168082 RepID=A0ABW5DUB4_9PROT